MSNFIIQPLYKGDHWERDLIQQDESHRLAYTIGQLDLADRLEGDSKRISRLEECLSLFLENIETPEPECSCHLHPPCPDCTEWGGLREAITQARKLLTKGGIQ